MQDPSASFAVDRGLSWSIAPPSSTGLIGGVLLLSIATAFAALGVSPLESHEIFVVQSTIEMIDRCDWIVPYYNGEPRLNKPPLNYWLTAVSAELRHGGAVTAVDGRIPSAIAGVWMVAMTVWCGHTLWTLPVGLWAGALMATTVGFGEYTHSARPEMVYASLCATALALFAAAWRSEGRGWSRLIATWGMWICFGLATLAKGPHIPAAMLLSFVVTLAVHPQSRPSILKIMRPVTGLLLMTAIAAPWWLVVSGQVGADVLAQSELSGSRFRLSPLNILDPYYLYRTWALLLPWIPLFPGAVWLAARPSRHGFAAQFLGLVVLSGVFVLGFGGGKRWYYMLPYMTPLCLLMALSLQDLLETAGRWMNRRRSAQVLLLLTLTMLAAISVIAVRSDTSRAAPYAQALCIVAAVTITVGAGVIAWWFEAASPAAPRQSRTLACFTIATACLITLLIRSSATLDSPDRWIRHTFGQLVKQQVAHDDMIGIYGIEPAFVLYHRQTMVAVVEDLGEWISTQSSTDARHWLCFPSDRLSEVERSAHLLARYDIEACDDGRAWSLGLAEARSLPPLSEARAEGPAAWSWQGRNP